MKISSGKIQTAKKVIIYGVEGIGKSTLASKFPDPLFIDTEGSTKELDVKRFEDKPSSWEMLKAQIEFVRKNIPCKTLVIDTIDWAEQLCIKSICDAHSKKGIEDFNYGSGYTYEAEEFGRFLNFLNEIVNAGVNIVLTAHAIIRKFEQPNETGAYDRYELKLGKKTTNQIAPLVKEWADMILFANYKIFSVAADDKGKKHKAQGGQRVMYTTHHPCWDAKNRYGLPDELPLDYECIRHILEQENTVVYKTAPVEPVVQTSSVNIKAEPPIPEGIPKALADLMATENISDEQIRRAVAGQGYYPYDMAIKDYSQEFIEGCLIGAWEQLVSTIRAEDNDLPFIEE